jgi:O-antigen ligase
MVISRLPFREDRLFSVIFLLTLTVPLAFSLYTRENFETIKYALWLALSGVCLAILAYRLSTRRQAHAGCEQARLPAPKIAGNGGQANFLFSKLFLASLVLFALWAVVAVIFSPDKFNSVFGFYYRFSNSLLFYGLLVILILLLCLMRKLEYFVVLLKVLVFDGFAVAVLALLQSQGFAYYEGLSAPAILRAPSLLGNPIFSSMFLVSLLPFAIYFFYRAKNFSGKIYYGLATVFSVLALIVLASRGAWVALLACFMAIMILGLMYLRSKKMLAFVLLGFLAISLMAFSFLSVYQLQSGRLNLSFVEENISTRFYAWDMARQAIARFPFAGVGLGNFQQFFEQNRGKVLSGASQIFDDPHNLYLQLAATGGWPLLIFFLVLLAVPLALGIKAFKKDNDYFALAGVGSAVAFGTAAAFTPVAIPCFLVLAVVLVSLLVAKGEVKSFALPSKFFVWPLAMAAAFLLYCGIALIAAEHLFYQASTAYAWHDYQKAGRLSAWALKLNPTDQLYYLYNNASRILSSPQDPAIFKQQQTLLSLHPTAANTYSMLATLDFLSFLTTRQASFFERAVNEMNHALAIDPYFSARYLRLGYFYLFGGRLDLARAATEAGLSLDKQWLPGWLQLAKIYQIQGEKPQTLFSLEQAYKLRPDLRELKELLAAAKAAPDIRSVNIILPPEAGSLE